MNEKVLPRATRFSVVSFCLIGIRVWQWSSSLFVWVSFSLLHHHIQGSRLGASNRMKGVQYLGLVSYVYSTLALIICGAHISKTLGLRSWRVLALVTLPGDLTTMGICLANITILALSGVPADCHGLTSDSYDGSELMRQPADGYDTIYFGSWSTATSGELDRLCTIPRVAYGLSAVSIFSYTFSLLLSVLYIQQHRRQVPSGEQTYQQGPNSPRPTLRHIGSHVASSMHAPSILDLDDDYPTGFSRSHSPAGTHHVTRSARAPSTSSQGSLSSSLGWSATTLASSYSASNDGSVVSGGSLPPRPLPGSAAAEAPPLQRRWSTSTSSSYNANAFVVTDGFRPTWGGAGMADLAGVSNPPGYSSRPGSLYQEPMKYAAGLGLPGAPKS